MRAVVDIGSNSVKYLIGEVQRGVPVVHKMRSWVTRLGHKIAESRTLDPASVARTIEVFREMRSDFDAEGIKHPQWVVATSAVRDSQNPEAIARPVQEIFGTPLKVLSGIEEATYSMTGALAAATIHYGTSQCCTIDVGGASTEIGIREPAFMAHSFQAGAVRCHEGLGLDGIPVSDAVWARALTNIENYFPQDKWKELRAAIPAGTRAVAVGGSLLATARLAGATPVSTPEGFSLGFKATVAQMEQFNDLYRKLDMKARTQYPGMEAGRADVLCAGVLCLMVPLKRLGLKDVFVTEWGLRHGLLLAST